MVLSKQQKKSYMAVVLVLLPIAVLILVLIKMCTGTTTTVGQYPENVSDTALNCVKSGELYPFFKYDKADKKEIKINVLFGKGKLKAISLVNMLYYASEEDIVGSEAHNHAAMNKSFGSALGPDALSARYAKLDDGMKMSVYAKADEITAESAKYFLINFEEYMPETMEEFTENYTAQGFSCEKAE